jgi:ABC-2 type transport system permease protein
MSSATHFRYEVIRTVRNRLVLGVTVALPLVLFLSVASGQRHATFDGTSFPLYFMTAMAVYGALYAVFTPGARLSRDRATGWTRQMRITPLRARTELTAKVVTAYLTAVPSLVLLYLAGVALGVRLDAAQWLKLTGLILVGLVPFVVLGLALGYLVPVDALVPTVGGVVVLFALLGGVFGFLIAKSGPLLEFIKALPSYWLVQAGKATIYGGGWPAEAWIVIAAWTAVLIPAAVLVYRRSTSRV